MNKVSEIYNICKEYGGLLLNDGSIQEKGLPPKPIHKDEVEYVAEIEINGVMTKVHDAVNIDNIIEVGLGYWYHRLNHHNSIEDLNNCDSCNGVINMVDRYERQGLKYVTSKQLNELTNLYFSEKEDK